MAHPYKAEVKKGSQAKFKSMTGKKSSGQGHPDEAQDKALFKNLIKKHDREEYKVGGAVSSGADKFARGGRAKGKKGTNINIVVMGGKDNAGPPPMPPMMPPMMKPPMAPPPGGPGPGGMPTGGLPGMNRGGKVAMKGGAESGQGRLDKVKAYGKNARKG